MSKLLLMTALVFAATLSANADAKKVCAGKVTFDIKDVAPNADMSSMIVKYTTTIGSTAIEDCSTLILTPIIKDTKYADSNYNKYKSTVEILVINAAGDRVNNDWVEKQCYNACDPNRVRFFTMTKGQDLVIDTYASVPMATWMEEGAVLTVTEQAVSYNPNCIKKAYYGEEEVCKVPYLVAPFEIAPQLAAVPVKADLTETRVIKTRLYYPVNSTKKVESYFENAEALAILNTLDQPNFAVSSIDIQGWASPEAKISYNQALSENRAKTAKKVISDKYSFDESVYSVQGNGEFWDEVIDYVQKSNDAAVANAKDAIMDAVNNNNDLDKRESAIKAINGGKPYQAIFKNAYPRSRFSDIIVTFKMKNFCDYDALAFFKANPEKVSVEEYVALLNTEVNPTVLAKALEVYPDDVRLNAIAGKFYFDKGNGEEAVKYYKKAGETAQVINNLGCAYLLAGDTANAKACFDQAKDLNVSEANEVELRKAALNQKYFAE